MADLSGRVFVESFKAWESEAGIIVNVGGTRSGKTYSVLQLLALIANRSKTPLLISVVTATFPQLRQGAMRDFAKVIEELPINYHENKSTHTWEVGKSQIEFFSAMDEYTKVLGSQRDILFVNECNRVSYEVVRQLMVRTSGKKFFDYNPVSDFWINKEILPRQGVVTIHSTYKDNKHLSLSQIAEIESHKKDENWWRVYGLGLEGRLDGLVFPQWDTVTEFPEGAKVRYGMDFGYNDPTTLVKVGVIGDDLYLEELIYTPGMITSEVSRKLSFLGLEKRADKILGDAAAAEQIETLYRDGWNIHLAKKGRGSIVAGINAMKEYNIHIVASSQNLQREFLNYTWEKDRYDNTLDVPIDSFNHAIDACRYALGDLSGGSGTYNISFA